MDLPILQILANTPVWVGILCLFLIMRGVARLRPGVRKIDKVLITPLLFIAWGLYGLSQRDGTFSVVLLHWLIGAALGFALGGIGKMSLQVDEPRRLVLLPGSALPLLRIVVIFGAHYVLNVAAALHPDARAWYMGLDVYVSGASAGYFAAWALKFFRSCREAPHVDLGHWQRGSA